MDLPGTATADHPLLGLALAMVDRSARQLCHPEWQDGFAEYVDAARALQHLPGATRTVVPEEDRAGLVDQEFTLGIGLTLLGQVALRVLDALDDPDVVPLAGPGGGDRAALAARVAGRVVAPVRASLPQLDEAPLRTAVELQLLVALERSAPVPVAAPAAPTDDAGLEAGAGSGEDSGPVDGTTDASRPSDEAEAP